MAFWQNTKNKVSNTKNRFANALFGTPTVNYGAENQAYLDELAKDTSFQDLAQRNNLTTDEALAGVMQGLNYGNKGIAQKQQELGINTPQDNEQIGLARQGLLNDYTTRQGGLVNNIVSGYEENLNNKFNPSNLEFGQNKGLGTRIGEAFGTTTRFLNSPIGRGLAVGGAALALGSGAPLASILGVKSAVGRQKAITGDKIYRNQLQQLGMSDDELNEIQGPVTKDLFEGYTSGLRLGNQRVTYGQLAQFSPEVAQAVANNPELEYQYLPVNFARDVYGLKRDTAEGKMEKVAAETKKIEEETKHVGKPKVNINIKKGGTNSTITHVGGENNSTQPTDAGIVRVQAPNGQKGTVPRARLREAIKAGYKVI